MSTIATRSVPNARGFDSNLGGQAKEKIRRSNRFREAVSGKWLSLGGRDSPNHRLCGDRISMFVAGHGQPSRSPSRPAEIAEYGKVGKEFYPEFY